MALQNFVDRVGPVVSAEFLNQVDELMNSQFTGVDSGAVNAYVVAVPSDYSFTLAAGALVRFTTANVNTSTATLNVGGTGVKAIRYPDGTALNAGAVQAGPYNWVEYDGTNWRLLSAQGLQVSGTFNPVVAGATTPGNQNYAAQTAYYKRVGNIIYFSIYVVLSLKDAAASGSVIITGLPFTSANTGNQYQGVTLGQWGNITLAGGYSNVSARLGFNESVINILKNGSGLATANVTMAELSNTTSLNLSGFYFIA